MNKRQVKVGMVLKLKYCHDLKENMYYDYKESM